MTSPTVPPADDGSPEAPPIRNANVRVSPAIPFLAFVRKAARWGGQASRQTWVAVRSAYRRCRAYLRDADLYDVGHGVGCRCETCQDKRWWHNQW